VDVSVNGNVELRIRWLDGDLRRYHGVVRTSEHTVHGNHVSQHWVQLCDSSESMSAAAAAFLADAHAAGDSLVVVAREGNWINIHRTLTERGIDVGDAVANGRIVAMNAVTKLAQLSRNGMPHAPSFDAVIAEPVSALAARGPVSIYGEMVDVLAEVDEVDAAIALEEMWNGLAERTSFRLLCGYSSAHFVSRRSEVRLRDVCRAHTHVRSNEADMLGGWLLKRSNLAVTPGPLPSARS
jgi:DcmR-like sensory protein